MSEKAKMGAAVKLFVARGYLSNIRKYHDRSPADSLEAEVVPENALIELPLLENDGISCKTRCGG